MLTVEECARKAFEAALRGDTKVRDHWCALGANLIKFAQRVDHDMPPLASKGIELEEGHDRQIDSDDRTKPS